jgi:TonB family protein
MFLRVRILAFIAILMTLFSCAPNNPQVSTECVDTRPMPGDDLIINHDVDPQVITRVEPEYPLIAHQAGLTGTANVNVLVDRCGRVRTAKVATSSGTQALDDAVIGVIYQWRFSPASDNGSPVAAWTSVVIEFKLP